MDKEEGKGVGGQTLWSNTTPFGPLNCAFSGPFRSPDSTEPANVDT